MNKLKKYILPMICKFLLTPKNFVEPSFDVKHVDCSKENVRLLTNTSNNIFCIKNDGKRLYFRECKRHLSIDEYVANEIDYYYTQIRSELNADRIFVENALRCKKNFNKFVNMGMVNDFSSGAYNFCMGNGGKYIGLEGLSKDMEERLKEFVQYVWGELFVYKLNGGVKVGNYQTYNATRSIATYRIAKLLGLKNLVPKTEYAFLTIDKNVKIFGTIMEEAPGCQMDRVALGLREKVCSPALQKSLNNLNLLDVLCLEKDHRVGNYNVIIKNEKAEGVVAFDNDSPNSFGVGSVTFETYAGCSPLIIENNINRPYVDIELARNVFRITDKEIQNEVGDLLNSFQLFTLKRRLNKIKKVMSLMPEDRFLENWSEETIQEELSGKYGDTYLRKFLQEQVIAYQPWIKKDSLDL